MANFNYNPVQLMDRIISFHGLVGNEGTLYDTAKSNINTQVGINAFWEFRKSVAKRLYRITEAEAQLWYISQTNLNTETGYAAYYALEKSITRRHGDDAVLCDLAPNFAWDDRLADAWYNLQALDPNPA